MPLTVCHLGKFYPPAPGGMESHLQVLARAQADLGAKVTVICINHCDRTGRDVSWEPYCQTSTVQEYDGRVSIVRLGRLASVAKLEVCPALPQLLRKFKPRASDVLHVHVPNPAMSMGLALARPGTPLVISYHSDIIGRRILALALRPFERYIFSRAQRIVSHSPTYQMGSALLSQFAKKVSVLPMGIELGKFQDPSDAALAHARQFVMDHGTPLWLSVGRLVYYKGLCNALEALRHVEGKLMVVGTGPLEGELRNIANKNGVGDRVVWCGPLNEDQLVGAYHAATALWFPSNERSEAFGLVQVEAMASGCPVINTAIPASGVSWVSRHEETGLTVPVNHTAAIAEAAKRLLTEPGLRDRLALAARQRARLEFDQRLMAERSLSLYRSVLDCKQRKDRLTRPPEQPYQDLKVA